MWLRGGGGGDFGEGASRTPYGTEEALRKKDMKIPEVSVLKRHHQSGHHDGGVARSSGFVSTGVCTPKQRTGSIAYDDDSVRQGGARDPADRKSFSECALAKEGFFECRRKRYSGVSVSSCYSTACPSSFSIVDDPPSGCSSVSSSPVFCGMGAMEEETAYHTQVLQNCSLDELADYALVLLPFMSADPPDLALSSYDPSFLHSVLLQLHLLKRRRLDCQHGQAASSSSSSSVNDGRHSSIDFAGACTSSQKSSDDGKDDENDSSEEGTFKGAGGDSSSHTPTSHISRQEEERAILDVLMNAGYEGEPGRSVSDSGLGSQLEAPSLVPPPWLSSSSFVSSGGQPAGRHLPSSHPGQGFHRRSFCLDDGSEGDVAAKPQHQPAGQEGRGGVTIPSSSTKVRSGFFTLGNSSPSSTTPSLLSPPSGVRTPWDDPGTGQITTNASTTSPSSSCSLPSNPGSMVVAGEGERKESTCRRQEKVKHSDSSSQAVPLSPFSLPPATKSRPSSEQEEDQKDLFSEELGGKTGRDNRTESSFPKITLSPSAACTPELRRAGTPSGRHQDGTGEQEEKGMEFGSDTEGSSDEQPRKGDDMLMVVMASPSPPRSACSPSYTPPLSPSLPCAASLSCPSPCALPPPCAPAAAAPGEWSAPLPEQKTEDKEGILGHLPRRSPYLLPSGPSVAQTSGASSTLLGRPPQIHGRPSSSSSQGRADGGSSFDSRSLSSVQPEFLHPLCFTGLASGTKEPEQLDSQRGCGVEEVEVVPFSSSLSPAGHVPGHTEAEAVGKDPPKGVPGACLTTNVQDRRRAGKKRQEWHEAREGLPQVDPAVSNVVGREDLAMERSGEMSRDACAAFRSAQSVEELEEGEVKRGLERTPNGEAVAYFHPQQNTHGLYAGRGVEDPEGVTAGDRATPAVSGTGSDAYGVAIPLAEEEDEEGGFFPTFSSRWGEEGYLHGSPFSSTFSTGFSTSSGQYPVHYATDDTSVSTSVSREFVTGGPASSFASSRSSPAVPVDSTGHGGAPGPLLPPVSTSMPQVPTCVRPSSAGHPGLTSEDAVVFSASQSAYPGPGATESFALAHSRGDNGEDVNFEGGEVVVTPKNGSHCCSGIGVGSPFDEDEISGRRRDSSNKKRSKGKSKAKGIVPIPLVPFVTIGLEGKPGGQYNLATPSAEHVTARRGEQSSGKTEVTATRVARLSKKAMEFPYVHGVRFEIEHFAWTASLGKDFRRFLVKKHGFGKARLCAVGKIELWRSALSPLELQRELQAEQEVLALLPSPGVSDEEGPLAAIQAEVFKYRRSASPARKKIRTGSGIPYSLSRTFSAHLYSSSAVSGRDSHVQSSAHVSHEAEALVHERTTKETSSDSGCTEEEEVRFSGHNNPQPSLGRGRPMPHAGFPFSSVPGGGAAHAKWRGCVQSSTCHPYAPFSQSPENNNSSSVSQTYSHPQDFSVPHTPSPSSVGAATESAGVATVEKTRRSYFLDEAYMMHFHGKERKDGPENGKTHEAAEILRGADIVEGAQPGSMNGGGGRAGEGEAGRWEGEQLVEDLGRVSSIGSASSLHPPPGESESVSTAAWPSVEQQGVAAYHHDRQSSRELFSAPGGAGQGELLTQRAYHSSTSSGDSFLPGGGVAAQHSHCTSAGVSVQQYMHHSFLHHPSGRGQQQGRADSQQSISSSVSSYVTAHPVNERRSFGTPPGSFHELDPRAHTSHGGSVGGDYGQLLQTLQADRQQEIETMPHISSFPRESSDTSCQIRSTQGVGVYTARQPSSPEAQPGSGPNSDIRPASAPHCPPPSHSYFPAGAEANAKGEAEAAFACESPGASLSRGPSTAHDRLDLTNGSYYGCTMPSRQLTAVSASVGLQQQPERSGSAVYCPTTSAGQQYSPDYLTSSLASDGENILTVSRDIPPPPPNNPVSANSHSLYPCQTSSFLPASHHEQNRLVGSRYEGQVFANGGGGHRSQSQPCWDPVYVGGNHSWCSGYNHEPVFVSSGSELPITHSSVSTRFPFS